MLSYQSFSIFLYPKSEKSLDISLDQTKQNGKKRIKKNVEVMIFLLSSKETFCDSLSRWILIRYKDNLSYSSNRINIIALRREIRVTVLILLQ